MSTGLNTPLSTSSLQRHHSLSAPIVVGVDGAGRSASAVVWAADEGEHSGRSVRMVTAYAKAAYRDGDPPAEPDLARLGRRLALADLDCRVVAGPAPDVLVESAEDASLLVVGRRGLGTAHRLMVGSTSIAVAGRAPVPVVVVPEKWMQPTMASAPVVVGVEAGAVTDRSPLEHGEPQDREVLEFAFARAAGLRVPLIVVSAWTVPALYSWSPADVATCRQRYQDALDLRLDSWRERYTDVEVVARSVAGSPADAILDAAKLAQIAVIGRHADRRRHALRLGSTARDVLHHAERPVAVVPAPQWADKPSKPAATGAWGPMF